MVTSVEREAEEGILPALSQRPESTAGAGARPRRSVALPSPTALVPVTERARAAGQVAAQAGAKAAEFLDRPASLVHAHPPTLVRAREQHHAAAARHASLFLRILRLGYGYVHLVFVKSVLNGLEWVTETPFRLAGAAALVLIIWFWR
jgi:hypothetical protein